MVPPAVPATENAELASVAPFAADTSLGCVVMTRVSVWRVADALYATNPVESVALSRYRDR
jgi:hypothetical protein